MAEEPEKGLPLPAVRCLTKEQAAEYLGIGVTLLMELGIPAVRLGQRIESVTIENVPSVSRFCHGLEMTRA